MQGGECTVLSTPLGVLEPFVALGHLEGIADDGETPGARGRIWRVLGEEKVEGEEGEEDGDDGVLPEHGESAAGRTTFVRESRCRALLYKKCRRSV